MQSSDPTPAPSPSLADDTACSSPLSPGWLAAGIARNREEIHELPRWLLDKAGIDHRPNRIEELEADLASARRRNATLLTTLRSHYLIDAGGYGDTEPYEYAATCACKTEWLHHATQDGAVLAWLSHVEAKAALGETETAGAGREHEHTP